MQTNDVLRGAFISIMTIACCTKLNAAKAPRSSLMYQGLRLERHVEGRGRVVAEVDFSCGEQVLLEEPFAYALSAADNAHTTHCHSSLLSADLVQLQRCSGCKFAYYSSVSEQRRAWPRHRLECGRIARALRHGQTPSSLL